MEYRAVDLETGDLIQTLTVPTTATEVSESDGKVAFRPPPPWERPTAQSCRADLCVFLPPADSLWKMDVHGRTSAVGTIPTASRPRPYFTPTMIGEEDGSLWITAHLSSELVEFIQFFPAGDALSIPLPSSFRPLRIVGDRVYGVETDDVGVQRVAAYSLR